MKEAESEEELLVLVVALAAREGGLIHHLVEPLHVGFETLGWWGREGKEGEKGGGWEEGKVGRGEGRRVGGGEGKREGGGEWIHTYICMTLELMLIHENKTSHSINSLLKFHTYAHTHASHIHSMDAH